MARSKPSDQPQSTTVAEYLTRCLAAIDKTQAQVAAECGFESSNIITMMKQGKVKVPIPRIPSLAASIGVDPQILFSIAMNEYEPATWSMIRAGFLGQPVLNDGEIELILVARAMQIDDPRSVSREQWDALRQAINQLNG